MPPGVGTDRDVGTECAPAQEQGIVSREVNERDDRAEASFFDPLRSTRSVWVPRGRVGDVQTTVL